MRVVLPVLVVATAAPRPVPGTTYVGIGANGGGHAGDRARAAIIDLHAAGHIAGRADGIAVAIDDDHAGDDGLVTSHDGDIHPRAHAAAAIRGAPLKAVLAIPDRRRRGRGHAGGLAGNGGLRGGSAAPKARAITIRES